MTNANASEAEIEQVYARHKSNAPPTLTAEGEWASRIYLELRGSEAGNGFGAVPLRWSEIWAYCEVRKVKLNAFTLQLLQIADGEFMKWAKRESEKK